MQDARNPVTLATLDAMPEAPLPALRPVALKDCTMPQLEVLHDRFGELISLHERMSGACAALQGLVLTEIKHKIGHGKFLPWVKAKYHKSVRRAQEYMQIGADFVKETKYAEVRAFEIIMQDAGTTLGQIELAKLDLSHPTVAAVVEWSGGKSADQLLLALGDTPAAGRRGGDHHVKCPHCAASLKSRDTAVCHKCGKETGATSAAGTDPKQAEAIDLWKPILEGLLLEGLKHKSFIHLPEKGPVSFDMLRGLLTDVTAETRKHDRQAP